jgi:hypothetical protein
MKILEKRPERNDTVIKIPSGGHAKKNQRENPT